MDHFSNPLSTAEISMSKASRLMGSSNDATTHSGISEFRNFPRDSSESIGRAKRESREEDAEAFKDRKRFPDRVRIMQCSESLIPRPETSRLILSITDVQLVVEFAFIGCGGIVISIQDCGNAGLGAGNDDSRVLKSWATTVPGDN